MIQRIFSIVFTINFLASASLSAEPLVQCDFSKSFEVQLTKDSPIGEASIREHTIVWHPQKKKYYLLADVIPLAWKLHPNTYDTEIHLFSSPDLSDWKYHGVAIEKGNTEGTHDRFGVASPVAATVVNGIIYCPYSARRTAKYFQRSIGLAYSFPDPEKLPWNKTKLPVSDLPGEDDDVAIIKDAKAELFHLYHRTALHLPKGEEEYHIVHSQSATPLKESSWSKAVPVIDRPENVRAQELTGAVVLDGRYHLFVIEHLYKGGVKIAHMVSDNPAGPFQSYRKNQRHLLPGEQPKSIVYSGHITPVVKNGNLAAFFWTASQKGERYGLLGHPILEKPPAAAHNSDADHGWVSSIQYAPDSGFTYTLGNMRDGKSVRVFSGVSEGNRTLTVDGKKLKIVIPKLLKSNAKQGLYEYQFGNHFTGSTHLSRKNTWEFSVERKITALHDLRFSWSENYLNSHLIVGGTFSGDVMEKPVIIPKKIIPPKKIYSAWGKANRFKTMSIDSALGQIDLKFTLPTMLLDYRQVEWRARDNIHLIHSDFSLKKGESISSTTEVRITPDFEKLARYQPMASEKDIYTTKAPIRSRHVIVPSPKKVVWGKDRFQLESGARLFYDPACKNLAKQAREFFTTMLHLNLQEGSLDERWKHCLVLCNGEMPKSVEPELERMKKTLRTAKPEGSYALRVVGNAILIVGKSKPGIRNGLMTLFQLSRHQMSASGLGYDQVDISDRPDFQKRGIYVRVHSDLDMAWSRSFVAAMAELKYNQVYLHFGQGIGVRFQSEEACYDQESPSLSVEEFTKFVDYIKSFGMEVIPIWAAGKTMLPQEHFQKFPDLAKLTINEGINWDISLDETFEYHKSILDEIIEITGSKKVHLGLDEIYHFALSCRKNTGRGDLILAEYINRFTDYFAPRGIKTIVYHDMLLKREDVEEPDAGHFAANGHEGSEKALDLLRNREMLMIEDWSYSANEIYSDFDYFFSKGFQVYGSSWFRYKNIRKLSAYTLGRSDTFVCTYWGKPRNNRSRNWDPRGNRRLKGRFKTYLFLPAMGLAGEAAWNANGQDLRYNFQHETLLLFNQRKGPAVNEQSCVPFDLSGLANRELADVVFGDGKGFIDEGRIMDLSTFPAGSQVFGGIPFLVAESKRNQARAISVTGAFTTGLPERVRIPLQKGRYSSLTFLHTCHFDFHRGMNKSLSTKYVVTYEDGSTREIKLVNDGNIMAWAPSLTRFDPGNDDLWLAWTGTTVDGLPASIYGYQWTNPQPGKAIKSVTLQAGVGSDTSVFLLGLTGIKADIKEKQAK